MATAAAAVAADAARFFFGAAPADVEVVTESGGRDFGDGAFGAVLAAGEEGEAFEQMYILLVLHECAVQFGQRVDAITLEVLCIQILGQIIIGMRLKPSTLTMVSHVWADHKVLIRKPFRDHTPVARRPEKPMGNQQGRVGRITMSEDIQHRFDLDRQGAN